MLDKTFIQSFLRINNASERQTDTEIKNILQKAGWSESDTEEAIQILRTGKAASIAGSNRPIRPDMEFEPSQMATLLGVDVMIGPRIMHETAVPQSSTLSNAFMFFIVVAISLVLATGVGAASLYFLDIDVPLKSLSLP